MGTSLLRLSEVMTELSIGRTKARSLIWTGELPAVRIGRAIRVRRVDLDAYIEANRRGEIGTPQPWSGASAPPSPAATWPQRGAAYTSRSDRS